MSSSTTDASALIDARIRSLADWRGAMLEKLRALVRAAAELNAAAARQPKRPRPPRR